MLQAVQRTEGAFPYELLTAEQARDAQADAAWVRERLSALEALALEATVEIGRRLLGVRERIGHGNFLPWIEAEFEFGIRHAQKMMQVAECFGSNAARVAHLPQRSVILLAAPSTPEAVREEVLAKPPENAPSFDQIRAIVREAKEVEQKGRKVERLPPQKRRQVERREAARAKEEARWREERDQARKAASDLVRDLEAALGDRFSELGERILAVGIGDLGAALAAHLRSE